jgi:hypothetical protein
MASPAPPAGRSAMKPSTIKGMLLGFGMGLALLVGAGLAWAQEYSHARIVRLSFVEGMVAVQQPGSDEWSAGSVNTPIQEGFRLSAAEGGYAEVEFENSSTARLGEQSLLDFTQLALLPSGGKVNHMTLEQGYATFNVVPEGDDVYVVQAGEATLTPRGKTRFRTDLDGGLLRVEVFKGSVEVASPHGGGVLTKNTVLQLRPGAEQEAYEVSQGIVEDAWDKWVEQREQSLDLARNRAPRVPYYSTDVTSLLYGWTDLMFYGNWVSLPGYGQGWTPVVGGGWSPFSTGRWCWYPGFGYTWISSEPWGWVPYHYGSWLYQPGFGWVWFPTSFGPWSPAVVNWYQGPGWVGWQPRAPGGSGRPACPQPRGCMTSANDDTLRHGRPVNPGGLLDINPTYGRPVASPDVQPDRLATLPGTPISWAVGPRGARDAGAAGRVPVSGGEAVSNATVRPAGAAPIGRGVTPPAGSGIVFDSQQGRYVNSGTSRAAPAATPTEAVSAGTRGESAARESITPTRRSGPQENYPSASVWQSRDNRREAEAGSGSGRGAPRVSGSAPRTTESSREEGSSAAWGTSSREERTERSTPSSTGSSTSSTPRSSASWGGSSSGSGGARSSGGSSSGMSGGGSRGSTGGGSGGGPRSGGGGSSPRSTSTPPK